MANSKPAFMVIVANNHRGLWIDTYQGEDLMEVLKQAIDGTNDNLFVNDDQIDIDLADLQAKGKIDLSRLDYTADRLTGIMTESNQYNIRIAFKIVQL